MASSSLLWSMACILAAHIWTGACSSIQDKPHHGPQRRGLRGGIPHRSTLTRPAEQLRKVYLKEPNELWQKMKWNPTKSGGNVVKWKPKKASPASLQKVPSDTQKEVNNLVEALAAASNENEVEVPTVLEETSKEEDPGNTALGLKEEDTEATKTGAKEVNTQETAKDEKEEDTEKREEEADYEKAQKVEKENSTEKTEKDEKEENTERTEKMENDSAKEEDTDTAQKVEKDFVTEEDTDSTQKIEKDFVTEEDTEATQKVLKDFAAEEDTDATQKVEKDFAMDDGTRWIQDENTQANETGEKEEGNDMTEKNEKEEGTDVTEKREKETDTKTTEKGEKEADTEMTEKWEKELDTETSRKSEKEADTEKTEISETEADTKTETTEKRDKETDTKTETSEKSEKDDVADADAETTEVRKLLTKKIEATSDNSTEAITNVTNTSTKQENIADADTKVPSTGQASSDKSTEATTNATNVNTEQANIADTDTKVPSMGQASSDKSFEATANETNVNSEQANIADTDAKVPTMGQEASAHEARKKKKKKGKQTQYPTIQQDEPYNEGEPLTPAEAAEQALAPEEAPAKDVEKQPFKEAPATGTKKQVNKRKAMTTMDDLYEGLELENISKDGELLQNSQFYELDKLMEFLSKPNPKFEYAAEWDVAGNRQAQNDMWKNLDNPNEKVVIAVNGNWYDLPHKLPMLSKAMSLVRDADVLLTGRIGHLTAPLAEKAGGEPLLLQKSLVALGFPAKRFSIESGGAGSTGGSDGFFTIANLKAMVDYAKEVKSLTGRTVHFHIIEEGFLTKRLSTSLAKMLDADEQAAAAISGVRFVAVGARTFHELRYLHHDHTEVTATLVLGELDQIKHKTISNGISETKALDASLIEDVSLDTADLNGMGPELATAIADLLKSKNGAWAFAKGRRLLSDLPREKLLDIVAPTLDIPPGGLCGQ